MTPEQRTLAREALGLPNPEHRSFKNYTGTFISEAERFLCLRDMSEAGLARRLPVPLAKSVHFFVLTRAGAERALEPGETLDPLDFPPIGQD